MASRRRTGPRELPFAPAARRRGRELVLWLPRFPRSTEGSNGRAWRTRSRATKEWHQLVAAAIETLGDPVPAWERARVAYELYRVTEHQLFDPDNVPALLKPVLDAIVASGVLPDDSAEHVPSAPAADQLPSQLPFAFVLVRILRIEAQA